MTPPGIGLLLLACSPLARTQLFDNVDPFALAAADTGFEGEQTLASSPDCGGWPTIYVLGTSLATQVIAEALHSKEAVSPTGDCCQQELARAQGAGEWSSWRCEESSHYFSRCRDAECTAKYPRLSTQARVLSSNSSIDFSSANYV